jgi:hypothetical protein
MHPRASVNVLYSGFGNSVGFLTEDHPCIGRPMWVTSAFSTLEPLPDGQLDL